MPRKSYKQKQNQNQNEMNLEEMKAGGILDFFGSTLSVAQAQKAVEQAKEQVKKAEDQLAKAIAAEAAKPPPPPAAAPASSWYSSFFGSSNPAEVAVTKPLNPNPQQPNQVGGKNKSGKKSRRRH